MSRDVMKYLDKDVGSQNDVLLEIARKVVNSSPEPRDRIKMRDEILVMKEKERLGFNFNRFVTASLRSRWDVVEKATVDFLEEILKMNDQIEEDNRKYELQLLNLIVTRTTSLSLDSRIEQMAGLFIHLSFYNRILESKILKYEVCRNFLMNCCDITGYRHPSQLMDRYAALQHMFTELYDDYETKQNTLNRLSERLLEIKAETNHRNMLLHNQMAEMHDHIQDISKESTKLERFIQIQMECASNENLEMFRVKNAIHHIYQTIMNYRGMDCTETDPVAQLDEIATRLENTIAVVQLMQMLAQRDVRKFRKRTSRVGRQSEDDTCAEEEGQESPEFSTTDSSDDLDRNRSRADYNQNEFHRRRFTVRINYNDLDQSSLAPSVCGSQVSRPVSSFSSRRSWFSRPALPRTRQDGGSLPPIRKQRSLLRLALQGRRKQHGIEPRSLNFPARPGVSKSGEHYAKPYPHPVMYQRKQKSLLDEWPQRSRLGDINCQSLTTQRNTKENSGRRPVALLPASVSTSQCTKSTSDLDTNNSKESLCEQDLPASSAGHTFKNRPAPRGVETTAGDVTRSERPTQTGTIGFTKRTNLCGEKGLYSKSTFDEKSLYKFSLDTKDYFKGKEEDEDILKSTMVDKDLVKRALGVRGLLKHTDNAKNTDTNIENVASKAVHVKSSGSLDPIQESASKSKEIIALPKLGKKNVKWTPGIKEKTTKKATTDSIETKKEADDRDKEREPSVNPLLYQADRASRKYLRENCLDILSRVKLRRSPIPE